MFILSSYIDVATAGTVFIVFLALVGLASAIVARRRGISVSLHLWFSLALTSLALLTTDYLRFLCATIGTICAVLYSYWRKGHPEDLSYSSLPASRMFTAVGVVCISWVLLYRVSSDFLPPLVWEATTILNFFDEMPTFNFSHALEARLLWTQGLLSEGDLSLLYGLPTLWLLMKQSSLVNVRILSALYFVGAALSLAIFCKRFFNRSIATVVLFAFGLNELGLIFGRYGSSIASTLFALIIAFFACASLVARPSIRGAILAVFCLYMATLGYAPSRVIVVILASMTLLGILRNTLKHLQARASIGLVFCAGISVVCRAQHSVGHFIYYASVRGEEISSMFTSGFWPDPLQERWRSFKAENRPPNVIDYLSFGKALLTETTLPQARQLLSPFDHAPSAAREFFYDPLRLELYAKPLFCFMLIGLLMASRHSSRWIQTTLLLWVVLGCAPVLLTNRVDSYRTSMLLIPLSVWLAVGISEVLNELRRVRVPRLVVACALLTTVLAVTARHGASIHFTGVARSTTDLAIANLEPRFLHNATIGVGVQDFKQVALTKILLLQRKQRGMAIPSQLMPAEHYDALVRKEPSEARSTVINQLFQDLANNNPVILGPYNAMTSTLAELSSRGFKPRLIRVEEQELAIVLPD
jgi:hypothetical protein